MKAMKTRFVAVLAAAALSLGAGVAVAPAASAAPETCKSVMQKYERATNVSQLSSNIAACKVADTRSGWHLTQNLLKGLRYINKGDQANARKLLQKDWAAVITTVPSNYQGNLITTTHEASKGKLTAAKFGAHYNLMLHHVAYLKYTNSTKIDAVYNNVKILLKVIPTKGTPADKVIKFYVNTLLKSKDAAKGVAKVTAAKKLSQLAFTLR